MDDRLRTRGRRQTEKTVTPFCMSHGLDNSSRYTLRESSEQRTTLALEILDLLLQFHLCRFEIRGHACQAHHPFDLSMNELFVKANFIPAQILFFAKRAVDVFRTAH
jgi:hypothetical protein